MNFKNMEEKIMCPYNEAHLIMRKRMETHLVKCREAYQGEVIFVDCDFNQNHRVLEPEIDYHHDTCPDRKNVEMVVYTEESEEIAESYKIANLSVPSESWDDAACAYDPREAATNKNVLIQLNVASGSKKRDFRLQRRQQVSEIERNPRVKGYVQKPKEALPEIRPTASIQYEKEPDSVTKLMNRIKIGSDVYIPKYEN